MKTITNIIYTAVALLAVAWFTVSPTALAGSATWLTNPGSGNWNSATNWTPATVPNGCLM
jgi:hypothetical protein